MDETWRVWINAYGEAVRLAGLRHTIESRLSSWYELIDKALEGLVPPERTATIPWSWRFDALLNGLAIAGADLRGGARRRADPRRGDRDAARRHRPAPALPGRRLRPAELPHGAHGADGGSKTRQKVGNRTSRRLRADVVRLVRCIRPSSEISNDTESVRQTEARDRRRHAAGSGHGRDVHRPRRRRRRRRAGCTRQSTTPHDPADGILAAIALAAADAGRELEEFLGSVEVFIHGTTRAINAILTNTTARTALLCTRGHPDMLLLREGGRTEPFNWSYGYPDPYIPRALTYEIAERVGSQGEVVQPLDEARGRRDARRAWRSDGVEAVAVCLLWSIANPVHELALGELLERHLPGVPYTLSHALNPTLREYRRASSTAIDASLKPLMTELPRQPRGAPARGRLRRAAADGHLQRRRRRRGRHGRGADPLDQLGAGDGADRRAPLRGARRPRARTPSSPTPAARATT